MRGGWSRPRFLGAGVVAVISTGCIVRRPGAAPFSPDERATLLAAMDELIPAGDGMPSASGAGCPEYLSHVAATEADVGNAVRDALRQLNALSASSEMREFAHLPSDRRIAVLAELERRQTGRAFATLRDLVYEAYYTRPGVWARIGFEFYPPERPGPLPAPFDDAVLTRVREMPMLYREAV